MRTCWLHSEIRCYQAADKLSLWIALIASNFDASFSSLMSGLAALDAKCSSRLGLITVSYYLWTTFVAVIVGIIMVSIIHPGGAAQKEDSEDSGKPIMSSADALLDLIR